MAVICQSMLTSLHGLEGLTNIAGSLASNGDDVLASLQGFDGLMTVGSDVRVRGNRICPILYGFQICSCAV